MGMGFWDQVAADTGTLVGGSEVSVPVTIVDGESHFDASGIFERSYRQIEGEGLQPIPSRYIALRVYEKSMPVRVTVGMEVIVMGKRYRIASIREPGMDGITTMELAG